MKQSFLACVMKVTPFSSQISDILSIKKENS